MPKKVYVNIENGDPAKGEGRAVPLKISATETKPGSSKGQDVFVFLEPDGGNEPNGFVGRKHRGQNFHTDPKFGTKVTLKGKSTEALVQVSTVGGDKWKFKVSKKADGSGAKNAPGDGVEVWRKVYTRVGHMEGCPHVDPTSLNGKLTDVFIEIEKKGGVREVPHEANTLELEPPISALRKLAGDPEHPPITVDVVFVDRCMDPGELKDWIVDLTPGDFDSKRRAKVKVKDGKKTWPFDDWILYGALYLFDGNGNAMARGAAQDYLERAAVASAPRGSNAKSYKHKEGLATNRLLLDLSKFPNIERWMNERGATAKLILGIKIIASTAAGKAKPTLPWIVMATRNGWTYEKAQEMPTVLLHEFGHVFGHVLRFVPRYVEDTGALDDRDEYSYWYDKHGGVGNHCHNGSTLGSDTCTAGAGACVMFHATPGQGPEFCGECKKILKRAPMNSLGRLNVWGKNAWKEIPEGRPA